MKHPCSNSSKVYQSFAGHGVDVASLRTDDLDKLMLEEIAGQASSTVLDLGCGAGGQSLRAAKVGAKVTAVDIFDFTEQFAALRSNNDLPKDSLSFIQGDIKKLSTFLAGQSFDYAYCQRTLHYLSYQEALKALKYLRQIITQKLFISVTGLDTTLAKNYAAKNLPIEDRFANLPIEDQETFQIYEPVCLYSEDEFVALLEQAGWQIEWCRQSDFGNIKVVCN